MTRILLRQTQILRKIKPVLPGDEDVAEYPQTEEQTAPS